ncbi:hypothetical protein D3C85_855580 [compost metagenome]
MAKLAVIALRYRYAASGDPVTVHVGQTTLRHLVFQPATLRRAFSSVASDTGVLARDSSQRAG